MTLVDRGQEMIETSKIPAIIAPLTLYIRRTAVRKPPQKIPTHMVCEAILSTPGGQNPVSGSRSAMAQPASSRGTDVAPVMAPIPAE